MGHKSLSLIIQKIQIQRQHGKESCIRIKNSELIYNFQASPTPISGLYQLKLVYRLKGSPKVYLFGDNLKKIEDPNFPHIYGKDIPNNRVQLCLYYPGSSEWNRSMLLVDTIIPWAVEWLFHYESWLVTNKWKGGGVHPVILTDKKI